MPQQNYAAAEIEHPKKVLSVSFVAHDQPAEVLQPSKQPFNLPASAIPDRMANDDWRRRSPEFNSPNLQNNLALRDALKPIAQRHGTSVSSVAIAWVLSWPGVTSAIVGARSPEQVDGWIGAANLTLTPDDLHQISHAVNRTRAGTGPSVPNLEVADYKGVA
jgi:hypothetical protein